MLKTRTKETLCPNCGSALDSLSGDKVPTEGDFSVCFYCGGILVVKKDLTVALSSQGEKEVLEKYFPEAWAELMKYKDAIIKTLGGIQ